jgi:hypothetical protein
VRISIIALSTGIFVAIVLSANPGDAQPPTSAGSSEGGDANHIISVEMWGPIEGGGISQGPYFTELVKNLFDDVRAGCKRS